VLAGETGSGKTTQLPKMRSSSDEAFAGRSATPSPRLAARTVRSALPTSWRPARDVVGYTVRFTDQVSDRTLVKVMTDASLLAEIQRDRELLRYDTIIVDEAHERSLISTSCWGISVAAARRPT